MNVVQTTPFGSLVQSRGQVTYRESSSAEASPALAAPAEGVELFSTLRVNQVPETPVATRNDTPGSADKSSDSTKVRTSKTLLDLYA